MSTTNAKGSDKEITRGSFWDRRKKRMEEMGLANKVIVSLEKDLVETFKALAPQGKRYQDVMEQALQEWLAAQGVKELLREDLAELVKQALTSERRKIS